MLSALKSGVWILAVLSLLLVARSALAYPWYIVDGDSIPNPEPKVLYDYNIGDGAASNPRTVTVNAAANAITGITVSPDKTLYAATNTNDNSLYTIDPMSGAATLIGPTTLVGTSEGDLGFDLTTNTLYAVYAAPHRSLYRLSTATGAATLVGSIAADDPSGLAFDSAGNLWIMDTNKNGSDNLTLLRIDTSDASIIDTIPTNLTLSTVDTLGLGFDNNGNLFAALDNGNFYSVNTTTGVMTFVDTHDTEATGLALVPEPSAAALLLPIPLLALVWFLWCRKQMKLSAA